MHRFSQNSFSVVCFHLFGRERLKGVLDTDETTYAISRGEKRLMQAIEGSGGRARPLGGDRVLVLYDHDHGAVHGAIDMQRRIAGLPPVSGVRLQLQMGVCLDLAAKGLDRVEREDHPVRTLAASAGPGKLLLAVPRRTSERLPLELREHPLEAPVLKDGKRSLAVHDVPWGNIPASWRWQSGAQNSALPHLWLHTQERQLHVTPESPTVVIGRLESCDLPLNDSAVSRHHAHIEFRDGFYYLIDQSTNGTFLIPDGGAERRVHRSEVILPRSGQIRCGLTRGQAEGQTIHFHLELPN